MRQLENIEAFYPLTPLQEGMLFHSLSEPDSTAYFNQTAVTLHGELDAAAFEQAWQRVVDHHPVLRTFFVWDDLETPIQVVQRQARMPFEPLDWRPLSLTERVSRFEALRQADLDLGCDLTKAPLMRLSLIRSTDDSWDLLWSFHHILMDGWSLFLVLGQVFEVYEALRAGREPVLQPSRAYRDYIVWLQQQHQAEAETFWRRTLQGFSAPTPLPAGGPSGEPTTGREAFEARLLLLTPEITEALQTLAQKHRLTMNTILQGSWALLLSRYSGEDDVLFGTVISGRPADLTGVESMVGLFINTCPSRVRVEARWEMIEWLQQLQTEQAALREYAYSRLVDIQSWTDVPSSTPLFESIFLFENYHKEMPLDAMCPSLEIRDVRWFERQNYPLAAVAVPGPQLTLRIIYSFRRFDREAIDRMLGHWRALLESIATAPQTRVGDLSLLSTAERQQLVVGWNDSHTDYPRHSSVHALFEEQAQRVPDSVALVHQGQRMTYRQLNEYANQLAHRLRRLGVGPEVKVAVCMERSLQLVPALLGILKAGGAYVFLDPSYPKDRLEFMLADTRSPVLLTQKKLASTLPPSGLRLLCVDADEELLSQESIENPASGTGPDHLAYVSFTSGSTGRPKGVCIPHRAVVRLVKNSNFADWSQDQVFLQFATVSFDASTLEIWGCLLNAARLVVMPPGTPSAEDLANVVRHEGVTTLWLTAGLFHQMIETCPEGFRGLQQLLVGGDVLSARHVRKALEELQGCTLINGYGPTENTTFTCCHPMTDAQTIGRSVPIGRPVSNTTVYLLDQELQPVPIGVAGELYAGGDGLAREYLNQPELTAEHFIPDHLGPVPGARLYRTGDQARYLPDGTIEFLGRKDFQVKLRGFRIEPGEIEFILTSHPAIRDAVVMVREDEPGNRRLVAYFVAAGDAAPALQKIRVFLKEKLPDYMVPAEYLRLDAFPLTRQGKVDRGALPVPEGERPQLEKAYAAPRGDLEQAIAQIWRETLGLDKVGIHDNFFDLGGHSLHLIKVHTGVKSLAGGEISMLDLFKFPTINALAKRLRSNVAEEPAPGEGYDSALERQQGMDRLQRLRQRRRGSR